jgi:hypothetical protein
MSDVSDVQNVLVGLIAGWLYPNGTNQPSAVGFNVRVGAGWPTQASLDADLAQGVAQVSVYATAIERKTTRYMQGWQPRDSFAPTITLAKAGSVVTVGGALPSPFSAQNLAVFVGNSPYSYSVQPTDTLASIAAALAAIIAQDYPGTTSAGANITLPANAALGALRTGGTGTAIKVIKNQDRAFQITIWCSTPAQRTALANVIDPNLADLVFLAMPDGFNARIVYMDSPQQDIGEKARLFRRDFRYRVDYATTKVSDAPQVIVGDLNIVTDAGAVLKPV